MTFYFQDQEGAVQMGSKQMFQEMTDSEWTDQVLYPNNLENRICENNKVIAPHINDRQIMRLVLPFYRIFKKNPPKLFIKIGDAKGRHSVHALEKIEKGSVVVEYVGEWIYPPSRPSSYRFGPIDALFYRNYSGIVEDGFPNIAAFHLYDIDGIPLRVIFIALEEINVGEMLTINYGMNHFVKVYYHTEYNLEKMCVFFSNYPLRKIGDRIKDLRRKAPIDLGWKRTLELEALVAKLRYIFQTPAAMLLLLSKGILKAEEVFQYFDEAEFRYFLLSIPFTPNSREREIISYLEMLRQIFIPKRAVALVALDLVERLRSRIFFSVYLQSILNGGAMDKAYQEASVWNEAFDAIDQGDRLLLEFRLQQVEKSSALRQACLIYAQEQHSPLVCWLLTEF